MSQQLQSQNTRRRGPKLSIPLDADIASVRYYKFPPKEILAVKDRPYTPAPKVHLKFIPRCLRRQTPWTPLLNEWLTSCEAKKEAEAAEADETPSNSSSEAEEQEDTSCSSSTSGACSGGTVTTDFSSISSPRKAPEHRIDHHVVPQQPQQYSYHQLLQQQALENRIDHHQALQQYYYQQQQQQAAQQYYPYRVPAAASASAQLSPAQWAELMHLQRASLRSTAHPPPKLMNVHTAYLPELDAAVRAMMQPQLPNSSSSSSSRPSASSAHSAVGSATASKQQQQHHRTSAPSVSGLPWQQQYGSIYGSKQGSHRAPSNSSSRSSTVSYSESAHSSDSKDRSLVCDFCYQHAVHEANNKAARLPHVAEKGCWRGHVQAMGATIVCPRLLRRVCSLCGATGQSAHQTNYCPATKRRASCY